MDLALQGKVILVTGGGAGIGSAICAALARDGSYTPLDRSLE